MDKLQKYHQIIQDLLMEEAHPYCQSDDVETVIICDSERHHYQLTYIGWEGDQHLASNSDASADIILSENSMRFGISDWVTSQAKFKSTLLYS
jgi:hypothetical protein